MAQFGPPVEYVSGTSASYGPGYPWAYITYPGTPTSATGARLETQGAFAQRAPPATARPPAVAREPAKRDAVMVVAQPAFKPNGQDVLVSVSLETHAAVLLSLYERSAPETRSAIYQFAKQKVEENPRLSAGDRCWLCDGEPPLLLNYASTWSEAVGETQDYSEELCTQCGFAYRARNPAKSVLYHVPAGSVEPASACVLGHPPTPAMVVKRAPPSAPATQAHCVARGTDRPPTLLIAPNAVQYFFARANSGAA